MHACIVMLLMMSCNMSARGVCINHVAKPHGLKRYFVIEAIVRPDVHESYLRVALFIGF
jgi:hypothetical protein